MAKYIVDFSQVASTSVRVEAADPDAALELASNETPGALCAQCSGYNHPPGVWLSGDWEPEAVYDENDKKVWQA